MIFSSIIFDLDGTLLDTLTDISESVNTVLAMNDFPMHPYERYKSFVGDGLQKLMIRSVPAGTAESVVHACCDKFVEIYSENWKKNCIPFEGITAMLSDLRAQGCKLAVLSNKPHAFTCRFVDQFFQKDLFEVVFGQRDGVDKKPHPAGALAIAAGMVPELAAALVSLGMALAFISLPLLYFFI